MRFLPLLTMLLPVAVHAGPPSQPTDQASAKLRDCVRPSVRQVATRDRPGIRKLGELPPAKPIYTVIREVEGCPVPVAVTRR